MQNETRKPKSEVGERDVTFRAEPDVAAALDEHSPGTISEVINNCIRTALALDPRRADDPWIDDLIALVRQRRDRMACLYFGVQQLKQLRKFSRKENK